MRRSLEDLLLEEGLIDDEGLRQARRRARKSGVALARAVVEEGVSDEALAAALARRLRLPRVDLAVETVDDDAVREVPYELAEARRLLPLSIDRTARRAVIRVAMADPLDRDAVEEIEMSTGCELEPVVARVGELADGVQRHYRGVITKMIPRGERFGAARSGVLEPTTQPNRTLGDEASVELKLEALLELLLERGVVERDAYLTALRRLLKERVGE